MSTDNDWPAPDYWCTICDRGAEGCFHTPDDVPVSTDTKKWAETDCHEDECSYNEPHTHWFTCGPYCPCGQGNRSEAAMKHTMRETFRKMDALAAKGEDTAEYREAFAAFERAVLDKNRRAS